MLLDVVVDDALLPGGEPAAHARFDRCGPGVQAHQFVRQHAAQGAEIGAALGPRMLDQPHQLERGVDKRGVVEEQPRRQGDGRCRCLCRRGHPGGIEIEIDDARQDTRLLPLVIRVAGRHEGQLSPGIAQSRSRQAFDERVAVASDALVTDGEKMERGAKAEFQLFTPRCLHDLGRKAIPCDGAAPHDIGRIDLHRIFVRVGREALVARSRDFRI
jgi:hypothetical protein